MRTHNRRGNFQKRREGSDYTESRTRPVRSVGDHAHEFTQVILQFGEDESVAYYADACSVCGKTSRLRTARSKDGTGEYGPSRRLNVQEAKREAPGIPVIRVAEYGERVQLGKTE